MAKTFGKIRFQDGHIWIDCAPHVAITFKRVFHHADRMKPGVFRLSPTSEHGYNLAWFRQRYPMVCVGEDAVRLAALVTKFEDRLAAIAEIDASEYKPPEFELALPPREYQRIAAALAIKSGRLLIADDLGLGKQQPVDTKVLTPSGYVEIGSLRVGDRVIGSDGQPTDVIGVYPQGIKPSYRITFSDTSSVESGPDHLWALDLLRGGRRWERVVVTTSQIANGARIPRVWPNRAPTTLDLSKTALYLPMLSAPVEFDPVALPLPAYLVGQLIANGGCAHGNAALTSNTNDWREISARLRGLGVKIGAVQVYGGATRAGILGIMPTLRMLGMNVLSKVKRIPPAYLCAPPDDRIALLQGLMDGDGSCSNDRSRVMYHTTSPGLADDVRDLVQQLGGMASVSRYVRTDGDPDNFNVRVRLPPTIAPFSTSRKMINARPKVRVNPKRSVESVEYVRDVESVCIAVAAPDRLYVTEHAILTHNTVTAICTLVAPNALPALVVTMTHLTRQWESEIARFAPKLRVHRIRAKVPYEFSEPRVEIGADKKRRIVKGPKMPDVLIMNYHKLSGWSDTLAGKINTVIFDEMQELRKHDSLKRKAALEISEESKIRVGLTATPVYNYGEEIHSVVSVLDRDALGEHHEFVKEWCSGPKNAVDDPRALGIYLRENGLMIRRERADVGRELPPLTVVRHVVDCDSALLADAEANVAELARRILGRIGSPASQMHDAGELDWRMRQATGISKAVPVIEFVRLLLETEERLILFGWHHAVFDVWKAALDKAFVSFAMFTGEQNDKAKALSIARFKNGSARVLIMSVRAGAGIDGLQGVCRACVIGELDWSPKVHDQGIGRLHRDGQLENVAAYFCVAEEGSDPVIEDVLGIKAMQAAGIARPHDDSPMPVPDVDPDRIKKMAEAVLRQKRAAIGLGVVD